MDIRNFSNFEKVKNSVVILIKYLILRYKIRNLTFPGIETVKNLRGTPDNSINLCLMTKDEKDPITIIYYVAELGVKNFKNVLSWIETNHLPFLSINTIIIVYEHKTSECERYLTNLSTFTVSIELFSLSNLQKNIFNNIYSSEICILNKEETAILLKYYSIKDKRKIPHILSTGPECKYLNIKKGELVKFSRKPSKNSGNEIGNEYVRYVI